jgi:uncharacterized protein HemX
MKSTRKGSQTGHSCKYFIVMMTIVACIVLFKPNPLQSNEIVGQIVVNTTVVQSAQTTELNRPDIAEGSKNPKPTPNEQSVIMQNNYGNGSPMQFNAPVSIIINILDVGKSIQEGFSNIEQLLSPPSNEETEKEKSNLSDALKHSDESEKLNYDLTQKYKLDTIRKLMLSAQNAQNKFEHNKDKPLTEKIEFLTEEIQYYDQIDQQFRQDNDVVIQKLIVAALVCKGIALAKQGDAKTAITVYEEVDRRFANDNDSYIRKLVASVLTLKCAALVEQGDAKAAIATCEEVDRRFANDNDPDIRKLVASVLTLKCAALVKQGDAKAAIAACEEVDRRFANDNDPDISKPVAAALVIKGAALENQGNITGAITTYEEVDRRFANDNDPEIAHYRELAIKRIKTLSTSY